MGSFRVTSHDGTQVVGWRNLAAADDLPVVISNGLGTSPRAWPTVVRDGGGFRAVTWYYRGTGGGQRPADESRITIEDHVGDMLALMDHEGIDRALMACYRTYFTTAADLAARCHRAAIEGRWATTMRFFAGPTLLLVD